MFQMNGKRLFSVKDLLCSINPHTWDYRQAKRQDTYIFICKCTLTCWMEASVGDQSTLDQRICLPHRSEKNVIYFQGRKSWGYKSYGQMTKTALIYAPRSMDKCAHSNCNHGKILCQCIFPLYFTCFLSFEMVMRWVS